MEFKQEMEYHPLSSVLQDVGDVHLKECSVILHKLPYKSEQMTQIEYYQCTSCLFCSISKGEAETHVIKHKNSHHIKLSTVIISGGHKLCRSNTPYNINSAESTFEDIPNILESFEIQSSDGNENFGQITNHIFNKPFNCEHCAYSAAQKSHLNAHVRARHMLEKPFKCKHCSYCSAR